MDCCNDPSQDKLVHGTDLYCAAGRFQLYVAHVMGMRTLVCRACPSGQFQSVGSTPGRSAMTECLNCKPGRYQPRPGSIYCDICPMGRENGRLGATVCHPCGPGAFKPKGELRCRRCAGGTFSTAAVSARCKACPAGKFRPEPIAAGDPFASPAALALSRNAACSTCPQGRFSASAALLCATHAPSPAPTHSPTAAPTPPPTPPTPCIPALHATHPHPTPQIL